MLTLGLAIVAVIVINAVFTFSQEYRAEKALEALKKLLPFNVKTIRGGKESEVPAEEVVPGDLRLIESHALKVNNASLTGESEPMLRRVEPFPGDTINSPNIAFAGTNVVSGNGVGNVFATGMRTEFGRIALLTETVTPGLSPLQKELVKATRIVAVIAAVVGAFFFILGFAIGRTFWANFIFAIGITVALIPEGMLPTVTLALAMGSQRMAKRKALIKTLSSVETLGSVTVICTDKTGTLTQNNMAVAKIWADDELIEPNAAMITGDGSRTAIARQIGLVQGTPMIIEGSAFGLMTDQELMDKLASKELIFSRMTPKHKMRVVSLLKDKGEVVAVTGDGVNDAPALKKADIGISMGNTGTDVAKEASNMVLLDDNFATIMNAVEEGRAVYENIKKFLTYIFASNVPETVPYLGYILFNIPLPLTILQILLVDLGTDMLPALALGAEKPTPGIMRQPPRKVNERLLNFPLVARAYLFLGPIEAVACMFGFFWVLNTGGWTWGTPLPASDILYLQATTACLTAIIIVQIANIFACRSSRESLFTTGFFTNKLIFAAIAVELALQIFIVYHPPGNKVFSTAPISLRTWLMLIPFAFLLLLAEETRKLFLRKAGE